jgi:membrane fusion protein (multidrug efflux system)
MRSNRPLLIGLVVVALLAIIIYPKLNLSCGDAGDAGMAGRGPAALPVSVHIIEPTELKNRIFTTGTILANEQVELTSEASGRVTSILFDEGKPVRKGELLVKINDAELQAQLLKEQYSLKLAEDKEARGRQQLAIEAISKEDYDVLLNELNTVKAQVQLIEAQIAKTEIRAPFDGTIGLRFVSLGSYISSNTRIASILDVNPVKLDFSVPEKYVSLVHVGDRISFYIEGIDGEHQGEVYAVEPRIDPATRTLLLRARSDNPAGAILPGAFAEVRLILEQVDNAMMIPTHALIPELNGHKVFVVKNNAAAPRPVKIGVRTENDVQITEGLAPGDSVITSGILQIRPGLPVTPMMADGKQS